MRVYLALPIKRQFPYWSQARMKLYTVDVFLEFCLPTHLPKVLFKHGTFSQLLLNSFCLLAAYFTMNTSLVSRYICPNTGLLQPVIFFVDIAFSCQGVSENPYLTRKNIDNLSVTNTCLLLHEYSGKVGPLEPCCSLNDQVCLTLLLKESHFRALQEVWGKVGHLKSNLASKDQLCMNIRVSNLSEANSLSRILNQ